jgi:adenylosuccinate lyase
MASFATSFAISPLDGRYSEICDPLREYFSEFAYIKQRYNLELRYLEFLIRLLHKDELCSLDCNDFDSDSFDKIKLIEKETNHDVKAIEYYIRTKVDKKWRNYIHFGLTSHDVDNTAVVLNMKNANSNVMFPHITQIIDKLEGFYDQWNNIPMLSHTHGQPASPTTMGKELMVFAYRLKKQLYELKTMNYFVKFGGAVGNMNAHKSALPQYNWRDELDAFIHNLGLVRDVFTTQLSNYDDLSKMLSHYQRINTIMIDMCQDIWLYVSMGYFKLKVVGNEVGSSTMPHKVNPIQFENAEGNLGMANCLIQHIETKLPVSKLQRDLIDSTITRNIGCVFGYMLQAYTSIMKGLSRIDIDVDKIEYDLNDNYVVIAEAIQTNLKLVPGMDGAYEKLKEFCRGNTKLTKQHFDKFIDSLWIDSDHDQLKQTLKSITPHSYTGYH